MTVAPGSRLGPYQIVASIGAGGMGEVYRATDTRLSRSVAIKVLPQQLSASSSMRERFEREAKAISALNHPHICTIHDVGSDGGVDYLVMEYCEGQTLADKLDRGPLPIDQVLQYGAEIADALSRAHRAGIVHRDLKPSNVMVTKEGVKLLDFGLAKQFAAPGTSDDKTTSLHQQLTEEGTILGTLQYMSPEQIEGREADARSDIFAFGLVLYEMATGRRTFSGNSKASVMAAILEREPVPLRQLNPDVPPALEHLVRKCLSKEPEERWESAHDIAEQLRWMRDAEPATTATSRARWRAPAMVGLAIVAVVASLIGAWSLSRGQKTARGARLSIALADTPGVRSSGDVPSLYTGVGNVGVAIAPDGQRIIYSARSGGAERLYIRNLNSFEIAPIGGTEYAQWPFFSPDGDWIAYGAFGGLFKVAAAGGSPQVLYRGSSWSLRGGTWAPDGTIYFSPDTRSGLWKIAAGGGTPQRVTEPDPAKGENSHRWPQLLPGGKHLLFTIRTDQISSFDEAKIALLSLETGQWDVLLDGGSHARYAQTGHLIFARGGALWSVPFDLRTLRISGVRQKVVHDVMMSGGSGGALYDLSLQGDLVYVPGGAVSTHTEFHMLDRAGRSKSVERIKLNAHRPQLSPDGRKIVFNNFAANDDIWIYDRESGRSSRFSFEPGDETHALWTADGRSVIYNAQNPPRIMIRRADGGGEPRELVRGRLPLPWSCSPDGRFLTYMERGATTGMDIWLLPLDGGKARPLLQSKHNEGGGTFSPDGRFVAYLSNESGAHELYIREVSGGDGRWQVSTEGGFQANWSTDGKEVFYRKGDDFYAVSLLRRGDEIVPAKPRLLFSFPSRFEYDVTNEGFLVARGVENLGPTQINVILDWAHELPR